jgi:mannose-6-phosphate isomerase-like protein (cupin superfamily)
MELYVVLNGRGFVRTPEGEVEIGPGDCLMHPPGEPHRIRNPGPVDLVYYVMADTPPVEIGDYPDSGKMFFKRCVNGAFDERFSS